MFDLDKLMSGCTRELGINTETIQAISKEYIKSRNQFNKQKLAWRSRKRNLGWIPFKSSISIKNGTVRYYGHIFKLWLSRPVVGKVKCGSFSQDSIGRWYINLVCEVPKKASNISKDVVGIDLGLKTIATLSNGIQLPRENYTDKYADKLAIAQRARKAKRVKSIHTKIKNSRKDWNHKTTTQLVNQYGKIYVGNVSPSKLKKTRMAKSVSDAGWADFKSMLEYKAIALGVEYKEVKESFSTVTCSNCLQRTGPSGLSGLGVREWICSCGASHNRDVNAAKNILRFGHETLIKGAKNKMRCQH